MELYPNPGFLREVFSLLIFCLIIELLSGLFLVVYYAPSMGEAFDSVDKITQVVSGGLFIRSLHANSASFLFAFVYIYLGGSIYSGSYMNVKPWFTFIFISFLLMLAVLLGFVLPWGKLSLWVMSAVSGVASCVPYVGEKFYYWLWGMDVLTDPTLIRILVLHFMLPFLSVIVFVFQLILVHDSAYTESKNSCFNSKRLSSKVPLRAYFSLKDAFRFMCVLWVLAMMCFFLTGFFVSKANFIPAGSEPIVPIFPAKPMWYFLAGYAVFLSFSDVGLGFFSVAMLFISPLGMSLLSLGYTGPRGPVNPVSKLLVLALFSVFLVISFLGTFPVESFPVSLGKVLSLVYFILTFMIPVWNRCWWEEYKSQHNGTHLNECKKSEKLFTYVDPVCCSYGHPWAKDK